MTFGWALAGVCWLLAVMMFVMPVDYEGVDSDGDGVDDDCDLYPFDPSRTDDTGLCYSSEESANSEIGPGLCCCLSGFLCLLIVNSGKKARNAAQTQVIYIPQQPVQQVVHQTYIQQQTPVVHQQPVSVAPAAPAKSQAQWAMEARNFEVALNWDKAADSYEKAGLFEEAGRVRKVQMEKSGAGVNIHLKSGDTYHDSVIMKDDDKPL
jgi:hypothetical protein